MVSDLILEPRRSGRVVTVTANKAAEEWWDKLTDGPRPHNVKVDWASWKDEDEGALCRHPAERVLRSPSFLIDALIFLISMP